LRVHEIALARAAERDVMLARDRPPLPRKRGPLPPLASSWGTKLFTPLVRTKLFTPLE
jgi:hypothetical protein